MLCYGFSCSDFSIMSCHNSLSLKFQEPKVDYPSYTIELAEIKNGFQLEFVHLDFKYSNIHRHTI